MLTIFRAIVASLTLVLAGHVSAQPLPDRARPQPVLSQQTVESLSRAWDAARNPTIVVAVAMERDGALVYDETSSLLSRLRSPLIRELSRAARGGVVDIAASQKRSDALFESLERDAGTSMADAARKALTETFDADIIIDVVVLKPEGSTAPSRAPAPARERRGESRTADRASAQQFVITMEVTDAKTGAFITSETLPPRDPLARDETPAVAATLLLNRFASAFVDMHPDGGRPAVTYDIRLLASGALDGFSDRDFRLLRRSIENKIRGVEWAGADAERSGATWFVNLKARYRGDIDDLIFDIEEDVLSDRELGWTVQDTDGATATAYLYRAETPEWYRLTDATAAGFDEAAAARGERLGSAKPRIGIIVGADIDDPSAAFAYNGTDLMTSSFFEDERLRNELATVFSELGFAVVQDDALRRSIRKGQGNVLKYESAIEFGEALATVDRVDYLLHVNVLQQGNWRGLNARLYNVATAFDIATASWPDPGAARIARVAVDGENPAEVARYLAGTLVEKWDRFASERRRETRIQLRNGGAPADRLEFLGMVRERVDGIDQIARMQMVGPVSMFSVLHEIPRAHVMVNLAEVVGVEYPGAIIEMIDDEMIIDLEPKEATEELDEAYAKARKAAAERRAQLAEKRSETGVVAAPSDRPEPHREQSFGRILREQSYAVFMIGIERKGEFSMQGTAWAFRPDMIATNAHVTEGVLESYAAAVVSDPTAKIVCVGGPREEIRLEVQPHALVHPRYFTAAEEAQRLVNAWNADLERQIASVVASTEPAQIESIKQDFKQQKGKAPSVIEIGLNLPSVGSIVNRMLKSRPAPPIAAGDVAVMQIVGEQPPNLVRLLPLERAQSALVPGDEIAYIGFPSENIRRLGNEGRVAQKIHRGYLMALSQFDGSPGSEASNQLLHYDLVTAGGASGSPVFNRQGHVIGLNSAGNYLSVSEDAVTHGAISNNGTMRIKTGTAYGQRIDFLYEILAGQAVRRIPADFGTGGN